MLNVKVWRFRGFYATWSPSIDEGRVIKFLDDKRDVENVDEIPDEFWNKDLHDELMTDPESPPVDVSIVRSLGASMPAAPSEDSDLDDEGEPAPASPAPIATDRATAEAITAASKRDLEADRDLVPGAAARGSDRGRVASSKMPRGIAIELTAEIVAVLLFAFPRHDQIIAIGIDLLDEDLRA